MNVDQLKIPQRKDVIKAFKGQGGKVAAVLPIYYPRALFRAFSILPVEVWGPPGIDSSYGGAHLQPYICSIVHNALSFLKTGGLDEADFILVPHTCDSLQGLGSLLIDFVKPAQQVLTLYLPRNKEETCYEFLANEMRRIYNKLSEITGLHPDNASIFKAIRTEGNADKALAELYIKRQTFYLDNLDFYSLIRAREFLPAEQFLEITQSALHLLHREKSRGVPIILSGIVPEPMKLLSTLSNMDAWVVADDMACCGRRLYKPGSSNDPFIRLSEDLFSAAPDPTRGDSLQLRIDHLKGLVYQSKAKGVIFYDVKFCEPELFDLPDLRKALKEEGIPSLTLEVDINDPISNQMLTRIETFLEVIK
ncbi:MAG: 2-hydroxyacyl-CoA dehydratase subunit D [Thermodesulfobacteriota bacterium]